LWIFRTRRNAIRPRESPQQLAVEARIVIHQAKVIAVIALAGVGEVGFGDAGGAGDGARTVPAYGGARPGRTGCRWPHSRHPQGSGLIEGTRAGNAVILSELTTKQPPWILKWLFIY